MPKDGFSRNPYQDIHVSEQQREQLIELVNGCVQNHFQKYEQYFVTDQHRVDERRWEHVKSKDDLHVYSERSQKDQAKRGLLPSNMSAAEKEMAIMITAGTVVGELEDLMFGIINTTRDAMRIRAAYVGDVDSGSILSPVVEPSEKEPFRSLTIKWMATDATLKSTRCRDFVCIEATDIIRLENGERIGYHVLHSIEFPQTKPLPNLIRGNMSAVSFYRHIHSTIIDTYGSCIIDPGVKVKRMLFIPATANAMLSSTNYVRCGQLKKVAWMLQRRHAGFKFRDDNRNTNQHTKGCVMCGKSKSIPGIHRSSCKLCSGHVCYSCKVRERMHFIGQDNELIQRKITFCSQCMSRAINCSTQEAAQDQATGYHDSYDSASTFSESTFSTYSESSLYH
ncbi:hypothetical protein PHMEG_00031420 [Phytophthora megakarya]|uniref:FYVE-type domain-containing protein n=1 Tax=Phytophthora megakarya TaxID=4795 RepID=A0A225UYC8_9STRA|nr:hypothetical protein PHMEG_00031420 [Phytophthora megakarya]